MTVQGNNRHKWKRALAAGAAMGILLWALPAAGQSGDPQEPAEVLRHAPSTASQCSGPLGALLPECKLGRTAINITNTAQPDMGIGAVPEIKSGTAGGTSAQPLSAQAPSAPQPPTDLQRLAASSVGQFLPIFGASLFDSVPTTFAPVDRVPVTADYVIGPGDEVLVRVWGQIDLNLALTVDRAGAIYIPQVGNVVVAGLQFQQLPGFLRSRLGRVFRNFDLSVNMGQLRSIQILVVGQARRPGAYTVSSLSTLVNALFASGGPSNQGSMRRVQLKRGSTSVVEMDLYDLLLRGDKSKDMRLLPGDVVYIPPAGPQVAVAGSVKNPGVYELNGEQTVSALIGMAGGLSVVADRKRAVLERIRDRTSREVRTLELDATGLETKIGDGDVLNVAAITPRFENAVTVRGNVANPGRFPWRAGMRLRDVIPDKESLLTRDYWKKHNLLGFTRPEERVPDLPTVEKERQAAKTVVEAAPEANVPEINWSYAVIERRNPRDLKMELIPFNLGKLVLDGDESQNLELRAGDVVTILSQGDIPVAERQRTRTVRLEGEFQAAGVYTVQPGETLGSVIQRAGGLTAQAYLYSAQFLRESTRAEQQRKLEQLADQMAQELEQTASKSIASAGSQERVTATTLGVDNARQFIARLRNLKATGRIVLHLEPESNDVSSIADMPLEDGDRFVVPAKPATVNVFGAVYNQTSFLYNSKLNVADCLLKAGGPTRTADRKRMFVIRANGAVTPRQGATLFHNSFESSKLHAGDSVVVPQMVFKPGFMRGMRDWTEVLSQMALGAAAINVLR